MEPPWGPGAAGKTTQGRPPERQCTPTDDQSSARRRTPSVGRPSDPRSGGSPHPSREGLTGGAAHLLPAVAERTTWGAGATPEHGAEPCRGEAGGGHGAPWPDTRTHARTQCHTHAREGPPHRHLQPQRRRRPQATAGGKGEGRMELGRLGLGPPAVSPSRERRRGRSVETVPFMAS